MYDRVNIIRASWLVVIGMLGFAVQGSPASDYPTTAYDAFYKGTSPGSEYTLRMASDGHGHFLTDSKASGCRMWKLVDFVNGIETRIIELPGAGQQKTVSKFQPKADDAVVDADSAKRRGATAIGSKKIAGHQCTGYETVTPGGKVEVWVDDDLKVLVQSTQKTMLGVSVVELQSVSNTPAADLFVVPADGKLKAD